MNDGLGAVCDGFSISSRLFVKLEMAPERDTVLGFFDRIRKEFPTLTKLRLRDGGTLVIEEDRAEDESRRWLRLDPSSLRFGHYGPPDIDAVRRFGEVVLTQAPYYLTFSDIDFDHLELTYGFELEYQGNHDQLVAETILGEHAGMGFLFGDHAHSVIDAQPYFGVSLTPECDLQAYIEVKSRTNTFEVRSGSYELQPISVFLTVRRYWSVEPPPTLTDVLSTLFDHADELAAEKVVPLFVNPLAAAIASRP